MYKSSMDSAARLFSIAIDEVINPLLIHAIAIFVSVGYILSLIMPVTIDIWVAVFWFSLLLPLIALLNQGYHRWRRPLIEGFCFSWKSILPAVPILLLLPALLSEFAHPAMQIAVHGDTHLAFIHQLLYTSTPVENAFLAGHPAGYHWLYHALYATLVQITKISPPAISSLMNVISILSSFVWLGKTLELLGLGKPRSLNLGFMILLVYFSVNLTSPLSVASHGFEGKLTQTIMLLPGSDYRLQSVLLKVMNFQSVTIGILLFSAALYASLSFTKRGADLSILILISSCGIAALAIREIAALYIVVMLLGGIASLHLYESLQLYLPKLRAALLGNSSPRNLLLWFLFSLALSLPLVHYNLENLAQYSRNSEAGYLLANLKMIIAAEVLFLTIFFLQFVFARCSFDRLHLYVLICVVIGLLLTVLLSLPDENQYKGVYFLAVMLAISALSALRRLENYGRFWRRVAGMTTIMLYALLLLQLAYVTAYFWEQVEIYGDGGEGGYRFAGTHVEHADNLEGRLPAYLWIRDNTPFRALVVTPYIPGRKSNVFHERVSYVRNAIAYFSELNPGHYDRRVKQLERFYRNDTTLEDYGYIRRNMARHFPDRPIYAVVMDEEVSREVIAERGAELVFEHESDGAHVYRLNPDMEIWRAYGQY